MAFTGNNRPLSVTILSVVLISTGAVGMAFHLADYQGQQPFQYDTVGIAALSLLAIVGGVYMLRASNWARWLSLAWIALHVIISLFHSWLQVGVHILVCAVFAYVLLRPRAREYFRGATA